MSVWVDINNAPVGKIGWLKSNKKLIGVGKINNQGLPVEVFDDEELNEMQILRKEATHYAHLERYKDFEQAKIGARLERLNK